MCIEHEDMDVFKFDLGHAANISGLRESSVERFSKPKGMVS
jgi:hypothetical protein